MMKFLAVSVFMFGFVFIVYAIFFIYLAIIENKGLLAKFKFLLAIIFCLFVANNTFSSGYQRMVLSGLISD